MYPRYNFGRLKIDWYVVQRDQDAIEYTQKYQHLKESCDEHHQNIDSQQLSLS